MTAEAPYVSPYLMQPPKPKPRHWPGDIVNGRLIKRVRWVETDPSLSPFPSGWDYQLEPAP